MGVVQRNRTDREISIGKTQPVGQKCSSPHKTDQMSPPAESRASKISRTSPSSTGKPIEVARALSKHFNGGPQAAQASFEGGLSGQLPSEPRTDILAARLESYSSTS